MNRASALFDLPRKRTGMFLAWINDRSIWALFVEGIGLYLAVALTISGIEST